MYDELSELEAARFTDGAAPPEPIEDRPLAENAQPLRDWLVAEIAAQQQVETDAIDVRAPLSSFGLDSITIFSITGELAQRLGRDLPATLLWDFPTIEALSLHLAGAGPSQSESA